MDIIKISNLTSNQQIPPSVLCLGSFDGIHIGHVALINAAKKMRETLKTRYNGIVFGVWTFLSSPYKSAPTITTFEEKAKIFDEIGVEKLYVSEFEDVRNMSPNIFVNDILIKKCGCVHAVCGYNFRYGTAASGNTDTLATSFNGNVTVIPPVTSNGITVSSTEIRQAVLNGEIERAADMLGRKYSITSEIIHGHAVGTKLGFSTANQAFKDNQLIPSYGVYITRCIIDGKVFPAVSDVGVRPTFGDGHTPRCETHIIGFDGDIYGKTVTVEFIKFLRPEITYSSPELLVERISKDIAAAKQYFS